MWDMTVADLERYAIRRLGLVAQSVEQLRPKLPRWLRRLREEYGFESVPTYPYERWPIHRVALFDNLMALWLKQDARNDSKGAHNLRNLIGLPGRPYKV